MPRPKKKVAVDGEDDLIGTVGGENVATDAEGTDAEGTSEEHKSVTDAEGIPICPLDGGLYGDKAEAVVDWWFENHPELAAVKYLRRKTHRSE